LPSHTVPGSPVLFVGEVVWVVDTTMSDGAALALSRAVDLESRGEVRAAIEALTQANREEHNGDLERALVRLRRAGPALLPPPPHANRPPIVPTPGGPVFEIDAADLSASAVRAGWAQSGCLLVRGLVPPETVARLVAGIDAALAASDAAGAGEPYDPAWFSPGSMPDRVSNGLSEEANRTFLRDRGGLWTADSPRMLFELFEVVDDVGIGPVMVEVLGERPLLSALKCTLRRVPPDLVVVDGWHQDGSFLGQDIAAFNFWLSLSHCGRDAPGMDIVPKRIERILPSDEESRFDWSLSGRAVREVAGAEGIVRPEFEPGDALLFDHLLVHQTATAPEMTHQRHAIESWFFAPSAYPAGQLPLLY
jgi:hypothetical protein